MNRFLVLMLGLLAGGSTAMALPLNADTFTIDGLIGGSRMTEDSCRLNEETSVWVVVDGQGECIRYFHHGLKKTNSIVHVWFHGDVLHEGQRTPLRVYRFSPEERQRFAQKRYRNYLIPFIFLARPGAFGSSGYHLNRREERNTMVVLAAVEAIKKKHQVERFALSGQSGGGHLVAALLAFRNDIKCAVITSGVVSVRLRRLMRHNLPPKAVWDPIDYVDRIPVDADRRIFIIGDPRDDKVSFLSQRKYFEAVREHGHDITLIRGDAEDGDFHKLAHYGFDAVSMCVDGYSNKRIFESLNRWWGD